MGNRFASLPQYHTLIKGHGIVAAITFLFVVPAAILIARFYRSPAWALRFHIYLQVLTVALSTVLFILGFMAVGPERSLTNPHHGIGVAMYVLILVQALAGGCIHKREKGKARRKIPVKLVLHQWVGRAIAMLGFAQVPLGLCLYGSPKYTFILYAVWMAFLLVLFFILNYRAMGPIMGGAYSETTHTHSHHGTTVIEEKKKSRFGPLGALAAGAGVAALLGKRRRSRSRSRSRERRDEVIGSRRDSGSFIEEKYEKKQSGGMMGKVFKGAAAAGGIALAKNWWDKRQTRKDDVSEYSSVAQNTPSRKHGSVRPGRHGSSYHEEVTSVHRMEEGRPGTASGLGGPLAAATAISAANRPVTPRPAAHRRDSYDSDSYYTSELSPSRRPQPGHGMRNGILATIGLGWFAKKMKDRRDRKEDDRLDAIDAERMERERLARLGGTPSKLTGDGFSRPPRRPRPDSVSITNSSDLSSIVVEDRPSTIRPVGIPPVPVSYGGGPVPTHSQSHVTMPVAPPDSHGILHQESIVESGSENYMSAGGHPHRRHSSRRRRDGEEAAAAATAAAASLAVAEQERRRRSRSRSHGGDVVSPPVSVKVKVHGDKNQNVTLRRLTEQEAAAERDSRKTERRRRRADSLSSLSGTDTAASRRRYRRGERGSELSIAGPPPAMGPLSPMAPLSPPNPAFAKGRKPKDSAYYSGRPGGLGGSSNVGGGPGSVGSPESHGTWSAMSPGSASDGVDPAERRRRRRMERNQRGAAGGSRVEFT